ncbi:MAG: discoidin domain-containing protein [Verrucomicrobiota bacterium]
MLRESTGLIVPDFRRLIGLLCLLVSQSFLFAQEESSFSQKLVRALSPSLREKEETLTSLQEGLGELPLFSPGHSGLSKGWHSRFQPQQDTPFDLRIDLGQSHLIDRIAVFPVQGIFRGEVINGYGYPEHFKIELSSDPEYSTIVETLDSNDLSIPPQPGYPRQFVLQEPVEARYLRLRFLKHWIREDGKFLSALGEVMVLSGPRNVGLYSVVRGNSFTTLPDWFSAHLVDGQTDLGLPVSHEPSPSNGFLSKGSNGRFADKWVELELAEMANLDEVVFVPSQPVDAPDQFGHGFPRKFRVLISETADFENASVIYDPGERIFPNPGDNPATFPAGGRAAKFIRLEASELWHISGSRYSLTFAEVEAFSGGENVALGAKVTASDVFDMEAFLDVWRPEYLVDGYSSQNRLIRLPDWLEGLEERQKVETEINELKRRIEARVESTLGWVLGGTVFVALASIGMIGMMVARRKRALAQQQESLRARISRDLHDDLGSRLGGMRLLSESLLKSRELPDSFRPDLDLLHRSSGEATDAMRDIVWLLDTRERSLEKLRQQLKLLVPSILGSMPWEFHVDEAPDAEVDFEFRRQVVLAFRESLNNAARHSESKEFECSVGGDDRLFWFEVRDEGKGFDEATVKKGLGLNNLHKRAEALGGSVSISSELDSGTRIRFTAPYRRSRQHRLP